MTIPFERIEHTADLAIRVRGQDRRALFAHAAAALFVMMAAPPVEETRVRVITLEGLDLDELLVDWLNELIFLHEVEGETYVRFDVEALTETTLRARGAGGPTTRKLKTIKAATYHDLAIRETEDGVVAQIIFDV